MQAKKYTKVQVAPAELEDVLSKFSGVVEAAVFGIRRGGDYEAPWAAVVRSSPKVTEQALKDLIAGEAK